MIYLTYILFGIYFLCIAFTLSYALMQLTLLIVYVRKKYFNVGINPTSDIPNPKSNTPSVSDGILPRVTIQLPIYNEQYVAERLIDNIAQMDYPLDRLQVQVLDDSTDETTPIIATKIAEWQRKGFPIEHVRRDNRTGYKAGALRDGMVTATGEFIAIFDADFLPSSDFLERTIPFFQDPSVGTVQTRWGHLNQDASLLTRLQALQLNIHFTIEQKGREYANFLRQFNGTAGVWRKATIEAVGNWQTDTLIEDVDLSIRAQLAGWRILIREEIVTAAELPSTMTALKIQQFRWMKGGSENALKQLPKVLRSKRLSFLSKCHSIIFLLASSMFIAAALMSFVSIALMFFIKDGMWNGFWQGLSISATAVTIVLSLQIVVANVQSDVRYGNFYIELLKILALLPLFFIIMSGMAFHNTVGVIEGFMGKKTSFMRTPKFGTTNNSDNRYTLKQIPKMSLIEIVLSIVFGASAIWGFTHQVVQFQIFHVLLSMGYLSVAGYSILPVLNNVFQQYSQKLWTEREQAEPVCEVSSY